MPPDESFSIAIDPQLLELDSGQQDGCSVPSGSHMPRTDKSIRAMVLALHWHTEMRWTEIGKLLEMSERTAAGIVSRAKDRSDNADDFWSVYAVLEVDEEYANNAASRELHPIGSAASNALEEYCTKDSKHRDMTWMECAQELGVRGARSTIERVMHNHHQMFRYQGRVKPDLSQEVMDLRVEIAKLGLKIESCRIIFIDETWVEFNQPRHKSRQTRKKGEDPYEVARKQDSEEGVIRIMLWAAMCLGFRGPCYVYPQRPKPSEQKKIKETKEHYETVTKEVNMTKVENTKKRVALAALPGTEENKRLCIENEKVDEANEREGRTGRRKYHHKSAAQIFKEPLQHPPQRVGGVNWVHYKEEILEKILYPWIQDVVQPELIRTTGNGEVWLVEDNAAAHKTLKFIDAKRRAELNINVFEWPARSPDMNKIEKPWGYVKDDVACFRFEGQTQETIAAAEQTLRDSWNNMEQSLIDRHCNDFHDVCRLVIKKNGDNNFNR